MLTYPDGKIMLQKSIEGLKTPHFDRVIVTIVKEHCEKYDADTVIKQAMGEKVEICVLDHFTSSQSETICMTLKKMNVKGTFISKDSDSYVEVDVKGAENFLVGIDLGNYLELTNIAGKSFIVLNEQNIVVDIIEKSVCSRIICIGVYGFKAAQEFLEAQEAVKQTWNSQRGEIYLSHVASYMMGQNNIFSYIEASAYEDWGLLSDWHRARRRHKTLFVDIDGVVFKNKGQYGKTNWNHEDVPLENNVKTIKKLVEKGAQLIFCTVRPESQRSKLERSLEAVGIRWHNIIMGCNHSQRLLINDFANTNPYPSCKAINIVRDHDELDKYINEDE
jgi:hypothetical protein